MKKLISTVLLFAMALSLLAGCTIVPADPAENLDDARKYVISYFQGSSETTDVDYTVIGSVLVNEVKYTIAWTTDNENVKIVPQEDGFVLIDVPELTSEKVYYTLTATITAPSGATVEYSITRKISASSSIGKTDEQVVKEAYELPRHDSVDAATGEYKDADGKVVTGAAMEGATLTGVVKSIRVPYDASKNEITVVIQIGNLADKPIDCYKVKGEGIDTIAPGDTITVQGTLANYKNTVEFLKGATVTKIVKGPAVSCPATPAEILAAAKALEQGWALPYKATLTGVVTSVGTGDAAWNPTYLNLTCNITIDGTEIICYRLFDGTANMGSVLKVGDTITVTGYLMNYKGDLEYGQGCTLDSLVPGEGGGETQPTTPAPTGPMVVVDAPVAGTAYKFGMIQPNKSATDVYYICGGMAATYYLATDTNAGIALDVYLETTDGGYHMYAMVNGVKTYINTVVSGTHVNAKYQDAPATVYTYDAELKTVKFPATVEGEDGWYIFGNKNGSTYTTIGCYNLTGNPYYCQFYAEGESDPSVDPSEPTQPTEPAEPTTPPATPSTPEEIIDAAYALAKDTALSGTYTLTGKVIGIDTVYSSQYSNVSVIIVVEGRENKPMLCYRMKGNDAATVKVGDVITVTGVIKNYNGKVEFDAGCTFVTVSVHTCTEYTDATCLALSKCVECGLEVGELAAHNYVDGTCSVCGTAEGVSLITATQSMKDLITANGWTDSTTKQTFKLDDNVTVKINGGSNTGKAYSGDHIRIYATDTPAGTITISVPEGYELVSIKVSAQIGTYAFLYVDGTTTDICNETVSVSGNSVLLNSVKNGSDGKQVRVTAMEVVYKPVG